VSSRRPSPVLLVLMLVLACTTPVAVVVATGLTGSPADGEVETADGDDGSGGEGDSADVARLDAEGGYAADDRRAPAGRVSSTTSSSAPSTTASTAPPTTSEPPTTVPPTAPPTTAPPAPSAPPPPPPAPPPPPSATAQVVALVNQARAAAGCGAVSVNGALTAAAQAHSDDMAARGYFSHTSQDGRTFDQRIRNAGYGGGYLGENIAQGQSSARAVHDAWMNSPGHRRNILDCNYRAIGMGLNTATWTWTQDFGG
jgi:uncharacterized protein YkwD